VRSEGWSGQDRDQRARDVIAAVDDIAAFVDGMTEQAFVSDRKTQSAVEREMEKIAEACTKLLEMQIDMGRGRLEMLFPDIPWHKIRGFGNRLRHEYGRIEINAVWKTATGGDLAQIKAAMRTLLGSEHA
jgi:uncharacterized protein with HEPN domain